MSPLRTTHQADSEAKFLAAARKRRKRHAFASLGRADVADRGRIRAYVHQIESQILRDGMLAKATVPFDELKRRLNTKGEQIGLEIDAQHEGVFKFTHRV